MVLENIYEFIKQNNYDFEIESLNGKFQKAIDRAGHKVWYIGTDHGNDLTTFSFGDFRDADKRFYFTSKAALTADEEKSLKKFKTKVEHDKTLRHEIAKELVGVLWDRWETSDLGNLESEYLVAKGIPRPPGVHIYPSFDNRQNVLVVPLRSPDGELWNIQQIYASSDKAFHPGGRTKGCFFEFGNTVTDYILVGEGFATCAAAHLATGWTTVCAFNIGNLESAIIELIRRKIPSQQIVILSDFDGATFKRIGKNPGMIATQKLTEKYKCGFALPVLPHMKETCLENVDFADLIKSDDPEMIKKMVSRVGYFADIAADVFSVKKNAPAQSAPEPDRIEGWPRELPREHFQNIQEAAEETILEVTEFCNSERTISIAPEKPKFEVVRCGDSWTPSVHQIATRNAGFHEVIPLKGGGVRYEPVFTDLRLAFEERNPFVTHLESELVYKFDGKVFQMVPELEMASFAEENFDPKPKNNTVREFIGSVTRAHVRGDEFFDTSKKINFSNGWLDLVTREFRPHGPQVGFKNVLGYEFDENATCPEFDAFLDRILCGDKVLANMVLEYLGYILSGDECWAQKAMVLKGEGSNGKSTLLKVVRALIGKSNLTSAKVTEFKSEYTRQLLDGKLANISEETPKDALLDSSIFKDIVSGGTIQVRAIYGSPYSLDVRTKLLFSCNDMPPTGDNSHALLRRLLVIPFNQTFSKRDADPFIDRRLLTELPGIFQKSLFAYFSLLERGYFEDSKAVVDAVHEYQKSTNPVLSWLEEKVTIHDLNGEKGKVVSSVAGLFTDFKMYCEASGFKLMNVENFAKQLYRALPDGAQRRGMFGKNNDRFRGLVALTRRDGTAIIENGRAVLDF